MSTQPAQKPQQGPQIKLKQRKREAVVKHEPEVFRDTLLKTIPEDKTQIEKYSSTLELNENKLDYNRYGEALFELLIVGGLIEPGGVVGNGTRRNPFSIFAGEDTQEAVKAKVEVINKLVRRYKYLQRRLEETLAHLLQYVNKFGDDTSKLARAVGLLASTQLASMTILTNVIKEHLVKDGASLQFVTGVFKSYLEEQSMDHLSATLKKSGLDERLLDFFPPNKRQEEYLVRHFEAEGLKPLVEYYKKRQQSAIKDQLKTKLYDLVSENKVVEVVTFVKAQMKENGWTETEILPILWDAIVGAVDWSNRPEQIETQLTKQLTNWSKVLATFTSSPKSELGLLNKVQQVCYEDARFMKHYRMIVSNFYKNDVVSDAAVLYWYDKGAVGVGKTTFLKQMEPFVAWLREQEDESDEEEDDE